MYTHMGDYYLVIKKNFRYLFNDLGKCQEYGAKWGKKKISKKRFHTVRI